VDHEDDDERYVLDEEEMPGAALLSERGFQLDPSLFDWEASERPMDDDGGAL